MEDDQTEPAQDSALPRPALIDWLTPKEPYDDEDDEPLWPAPVDPVDRWVDPDQVWPPGVRSEPV